MKKIKKFSPEGLAFFALPRYFFYTKSIDRVVLDSLRYVFKDIEQLLRRYATQQEEITIEIGEGWSLLYDAENHVVHGFNSSGQSFYWDQLPAKVKMRSHIAVDKLLQFYLPDLINARLREQIYSHHNKDTLKDTLNETIPDDIGNRI